MASGHVNRAKRPNTWLHRPMLQNVNMPNGNCPRCAARCFRDVMEAEPWGRFSGTKAWTRRLVPRVATPIVTHPQGTAPVLPRFAALSFAVSISGTPAMAGCRFGPKIPWNFCQPLD
jgi:hypothetical protein